MTVQDPFTLIKSLYHFTDQRNLPLIRELKGLWSAPSLKGAGHAVPAPGGNEWSQTADVEFGVDDYVHLCFCTQHPMEFLARQEGRIQTSVFLDINPLILQKPGVLFTPGVSNKSGMSKHPIADARELIDFEVLYSRTDWKDAAIQARRKTVEKYEILVPRHIGLDMIRNFPNG
jgi:hypothetical protein